MMDVELIGAGTADRGLSDERVREALRRAEGVARSLHDLSHRLHPAKLRLIGLPVALHALGRELSQPHIPIKVTHRNVPAAMPPELTLCLFRVAQEALQNVVKHSRASSVYVNLSGTPDGVALTIADDGVGFDASAAMGRGLGLISMQERLDAVGGALDIRSAPGQGTRIAVDVPFTAAEADRAGPVVSGPRADSA
jgi:signal transduction histidine kinase